MFLWKLVQIADEFILVKNRKLLFFQLIEMKKEYSPMWPKRYQEINPISADVSDALLKL